MDVEKIMWDGKDYLLIKNAISKDACKILAREFRMIKDLMNSTNEGNRTKTYPFGDEQVEKSFSWYSCLGFESLSDTVVKSIVQQAVGEEVYPTYSYARIYYTGAEMPIHTDRSSSEIGVTCCIDVDKNSQPWNLGFIKDNGDRVYLEQDPGDIVIYNGNNNWHWRDPFHGQEQINAFLFYVKASGNRTELKYDTRPMLGASPNTRKLNSEEQWAIYGKVI
jgi:hypothetical protein